MYLGRTASDGTLSWEESELLKEYGEHEHVQNVIHIIPFLPFKLYKLKKLTKSINSKTQINHVIKNREGILKSICYKEKIYS